MINKAGMDKKVSKKLNRAVHLLQRHVPGIRVSLDTPSKFLYVANSGVVCGVSYDELWSVFSEFGVVAGIHVFAHKPYSFLEFADLGSAAEAVRVLQGQHPSLVSNADVVFYLAFLEAIPSFETKEPCIPDGGILVDDFVSESEEEDLWNIVQQELKGRAGNLKHRQVLHFGYEFSYETHSALVDGPYPGKIPALCERLLDRMCDGGLCVTRPDQVTVNVYEPGHGIPLHTDTHSAFQEAIISLSLLAPIAMDFLDPESEERRSVVLTPRSLLVLKESSRYQWKHGISPRKYDTLADGRLVKRSLRVSFTFRAVRTRPCQCRFPQFCDWDREEGEGRMRLSTHRDLEAEHVTAVYDAIASHFDATRQSQWPGVKRFLEELKDGAAVLDAGCGNGKYLRPDGRLIKLGCDLSEPLCQISGRRNLEAVVGNCLSLPFRSGSFDASLSIAVIHHLSSKERRIRAVQEQIRVLKVGGEALIFVWAMEQIRDSKKSAYLRSQDTQAQGSQAKRSVVTESGQLDLVVHKNREQFGAQDLLVPWELNTKFVEQKDQKEAPKLAAEGCEKAKFLRFYHVFREGELEDLCREVKECQILKSFYEQGNWCLILKKL